MWRIVKRIGNADPNPPVERFDRLERTDLKIHGILCRGHLVPLGQTLARRRGDKLSYRALNSAAWRLELIKEKRKIAERLSSHGERDDDLRVDIARAGINGLRRRDR